VIAIATLMAVLAAGTPAHAGVVAVATITGTVTAGDGTPLVGASVGAYLPGDAWVPTRLTTTDTMGRYALADVGVGPNRVAVWAPPGEVRASQWYGPATSRAAATPIDIVAGAMVDGIDVVLPAAASIAGTVTDAHGAPVAGATVWAHRPADTWIGSAAAVTGADGTYAIGGVTTDDYRIRVAPPNGSGLFGSWYGGLPPTSFHVADQAAVTGIDVTLQAPASITGTVTDQAGAAVDGATVSAYRSDQVWMPSATVLTAGDGSFGLDHLVPDTYQLRIAAPAGRGLTDRWLGPSPTRVGSTVITLGSGDEHAAADVALPFAFEGSIDLDVADPDRCEVIATDCLLPFPNDRYTVADPSSPTGRRVALDSASRPANAGGTHIDPEHWNELDGFSPGAAVLLRFPDVDLGASNAGSLVDLSSSLDADAPIVLLDTDTGERLGHWAELDTHAEPGATPTLAIHPTTALPEGHRIVVAVRGLVTGSGDPIAPTDAFRAFRDRLETDVPEVEIRRSSMERLLGELGDAGVARDDLIVAWDFTVASTEALSSRLLAMRDDAFARLGGDAPAFTLTSNTPSTRAGIAREVIGTYEVPMYLSGTGQPGSELVLDAEGRPVHTGTYTARFRCIVPASATAANKATTGLYGHGLLGTYDQIGAARAVAVAGNRVFCGTDLIGMAEEDVLNAVTIIQDLSGFNTLADRLQQGHLNTLVLGRLMIHPEGLVSDPAFQDGGEPLMDGGLVYYGISQGGIMGAATTAVAQDWTLAMLDVPGSNYSLLLDSSVDFDPFRSIMTPAYPAAADRALGLQLIQMLWDRGEANGYLQHLTSDPYEGTPSHRVLLHAAFGDHQVANVSTAIEARTIGAHAVRPALAPGRSAESDVLWDIPDIPTYPFAGSAVAMWDSGADAPPLENQPPRTGDDPHDNNRRTPAAIEQIVAFFASGTVIDVCGGSPCVAVP
jgi:protocatechuate 3,4-dioxygenase beta subunit